MMPATIAIIDEIEKYQKQLDLERQQNNEVEREECVVKKIYCSNLFFVLSQIRSTFRSIKRENFIETRFSTNQISFSHWRRL